MEVYIKESLYVLDYNNKKVDAIYLSDDHITPGYAYSINVEEANTGYSNLTFQMPNTIINDNGDKIKNPKLKLLTPLVKLRYERLITYIGKETIKVQEPIGYGDTTTYIQKEYKPTYPDNIIENYVMDYIVQPVEKKRSNLEISTQFNAIDYPRFNLSKKKFGITIGDDTVTRSDWSLYEKEPMDVAGTVKYLKWDSKYSKYGTTYEWDPEKATEMPLLDNQINDLLEDTDLFSYGVVATSFWWPITSTGRYNGILYEKGDYLTLNFYKTNIMITEGNVITVGEDVKVFTKYTWLGSADSGDNGWSRTSTISDADWLAYAQPATDSRYLGSFSDEGSIPKNLTTKDEGKWCLLVVDRSTSLNFYGYEWGTLDQGNWYLTPNNACNYLHYALENTNWTIKNSNDRYINTYFSTSDFPSSITSDDANPKYLIYKEVIDNTLKISGTYTEATLPTYLTASDAGKWTYILTTDSDNKIINTLKWVWSGSEWVYDYSDKNEIATHIYAWFNNTIPYQLKNYNIIGNWVDVTKDAWASSIDKKTGCLYDVDAVETEVATPDGASGAIFETTELRSSLSASDSNSYNIITSICKEFQLYPIFDCENRTVSLKLFAGKNYGLTYNLGGAINTSGVKEDGEKVITKLRCYGGNDIQSNEVINLGDAQRKYIEYFNGYYTSANALPNTGWWAVVDSDLNEEEPWISSNNRQVYFYNNSTWTLGTKEDNGTWSGISNGISVNVDSDSGMETPWDPNNQQYIQSRSPYGTEYVYNFKWMYDNGWMTKEQILGLYKVNDEIQALNESFVDSYAEDFNNATAKYINEGVNYKTNQDVSQSVLNSMANTYYYKPSQPNEGTFIAFPEVPAGCYSKNDPKTGKPRYYTKIYHCAACGKYTSADSFAVCPICNLSKDIIDKEIRIPVFNDADYSDTSAEKLKPSSKGDYQTLLECLGNNDTNKAAINISHKFSTRRIDNLNEELEFNVGGTWRKDTSSNLYEWNYNIDRWLEYYGYMIDSQRLMMEAGDICEKLAQDKHNYDTKLSELESKVQNGWGDYIVEGKFKDEKIVYVGILLNKSLEASEEYCVPKTTYNLNVIDTTGLIEYRKYCDTVYNDLVHTLHNVGQVCPKPGDYCKIYDEPVGLYGVAGLITNIKRVLDDPKSNSITIDTAYTDSEELVGNIINATNTVLNNQDIYARTAVLNNDGTISASALTSSLENNSTDNITLLGVKGSSMLDSSGLVVTDPTNPINKMKYVGNGVYGTTDNGATWTSMMTPEGINASYIRAGSINTQNVQINSGLYNKVVLDQFGLSVKDKSNEPYSLPYKNTTYGGESVSDWSTTNLAAFIGVDRNNEPKLYVKGQLVADKGSKIGGWFIGQSDLYNAVTNPTYILSPGGVSKTSIAGTGNSNYNLYINGNMGVTTSGILHAKGADISGKIVVTDSSSTVNNGTVGGWTAGSNGLTKGTLVLSPSGGAITGTVHDSGSRSDWSLFMNSNFGVLTDGTAYMTNAHVKGNIYADSGTFNGTIYAGSGKIGGWTIEANQLSGSGKISGGSISGSTITCGDTFSVTSNGSATIKSGKIGKWTINSDGLTYSPGYEQTTSLTPSGFSYFSGSATPEYVEIGTFLDAYVMNASIGTKGNITLSAGIGQVYSAGDVALYAREYQGVGGTIKLIGSKIQVNNGDNKYSGVTGYVKFSWNGIGTDHTDYMAFVNGILVYAGTDEDEAKTRTGKSSPIFDY